VQPAPHALSPAARPAPPAFQYSPVLASPAQPAASQLAAGRPTPSAAAAARDSYQRSAPTEAPVAPGDPRTLGFGTDQARWLKDELRRKQESGESSTNQFRMYKPPPAAAAVTGAAAAPPPAQGLPAGWEEMQHEGHAYFLHTSSGHTQWERP